MHCVIARIYPLYYALPLSSLLRPSSPTIFSGRDFLPDSSSLLPSLSLSLSLSILALSCIHIYIYALLYAHALYQTGYLRECDPDFTYTLASNRDGEKGRKWGARGCRREGDEDAAIYATTTIRAIIFACTRVAWT